MKYRKLGSDLLFDGKKFIDEPTIVVVDENAVIVDLIPTADAGDDVEFLDGVLSPGFVNCHCHLELSGLKNKVPEKSGMVNFLLSVMQNRIVESSERISAIANAHEELIRNGIVAVGDICNTTDTIAVKENSPLRFYNFIETTGFIPQTAEKRFDSAKTIMDEISSNRNQDHQSVIVPHAPYSVSATLFELIAGEKPHILTMHNQESHEENYFFLNKEGEFLELYRRLGLDINFFKPTGTSSLQAVRKYLTAASKLILVHNVATSSADVASMDAKSTFWCLCPKANLFIQNRLPPSSIVLDPDIQIVIGTDSLASNDELNILSELKALKHSFPLVQMERLLSAATFVGSLALGMDSELGSFEAGKIPGVIQLRGVTRNDIQPTATVTKII